ncbi:uncharacterized protein LOC111247972 isoform X3 [Varroa destructor]|uniref:Serine/threonine-protein kinase greatwall n=1 Tax=Varroa destructor TaxID=109461 RepID=A0A7M7JTA5_VARDE|nr:uncharacterized protein LOC111247972 isoform X3 [Varroa destructor]
MAESHQGSSPRMTKGKIMSTAPTRMVTMIDTMRNSVIARLFATQPNLGKSLYAMLQVLIKERRRTPIADRQILEHFSTEQLVQTATEMCYSIERRTLFTQDIKDMIENLMLLMERIFKLAPQVGLPFSKDITKFILIVAEMAAELQLLELVTPIDWTALADIVKLRVQTLEYLPKYNLLRYIPRISDLESERVVGSGGFGVVYKGFYVPANLTICIKLIPEARLPTIECIASDKLVASIINSPFLIQYLSVFKVEDAFVTLMEYVEGIDLKKLMSIQRFLPEDVLRLFVVQMFLGLEHLHYKGFVHRDLKLQNVLIKESGHLKVIDFDTTKLCLSNFVKGRIMAAFFKRTAKEFRDNELAGTLPYMAPESFKEVESKIGYPYGRAVDWWALGVTTYRLSTGKLPFRASTEQELQDKDIQRNPSELIDITNRLLVKNPSKRLGSGQSYRELRMHPYFSKVDFGNLHTLTHLCEVPSFREAFASNEKAVIPDKPVLEIRQLRDAPLHKQKPILTFASPGFMRLMDHLRSQRTLAEGIDQRYCDERRLYGLGTLSSERNYEMHSDEPVKSFDYKTLETMIGVRHFVSIQLEAESKQCFQGFTYGFELLEVTGVSGPAAMVCSLRSESVKRSGLIVGDIIYQVDEVKTQEGLERIKAHMKNKPMVKVSVFAMTPFRLADMGLNVPLAVSWVGRKDLLVTRVVKRQIDTVKAFDVFTQATSAASHRSRPMYLHVIGRIHRKCVVTFPPDENLYVADVVLAVNGASTSVMRSREEVMNAINMTAKEHVQITILPVSPLRLPDPERLCPL